MTDPKAIPLLPCPFCGFDTSPPVMRPIGANEVYVACPRCECTGPKMARGVPDAEVIADWNRRPTQADGLRADGELSAFERAWEIVQEANGEYAHVKSYIWACLCEARAALSAPASAEAAALKARLEVAEGLLKRWDDLTVVVTPMPVQKMADLKRDTRAFLAAGKGEG